MCYGVSFWAWLIDNQWFMELTEKYSEVLRRFEEVMPVAESELNFDSPFHLLIAVILSAQCTDRRVNMHTPEIFAKYPAPRDLASATFEEIFELIKSITFPNNKAKHLLGMAQMLVDEFGGEVPDDPDELVKLPGVGRKTANVVASVIYDKPVIAVDTHVFRVARRMGLSDGTTVEKVEKDLTEHIPAALRPKAHHWLILHGRYTCTARRPSCSACPFPDLCPTFTAEQP